MKQSPAALCSSRCRRSAWAALLGILWLFFAATAAADFPTDPASVRERQLLLQVIEELELLLQSVRRAERNTGVGAVEKVPLLGAAAGFAARARRRVQLPARAIAHTAPAGASSASLFRH